MTHAGYPETGLHPLAGKACVSTIGVPAWIAYVTKVFRPPTFWKYSVATEYTLSVRPLAAATSAT